MKRILIISAILLVCAITYGQPIVHLGIDPRNAVTGSEYNPPALDLKLRFGYQFSKWEAGGEFELFPYLDYVAGGLYGEYFVLNRDRLQLSLGVSSGAISEKDKAYATVAPMGEIRYRIWNGLFVGWQSEYRYRGEWDIWKYSNYVSISYRKL